MEKEEKDVCQATSGPQGWPHTWPRPKSPSQPLGFSPTSSFLISLPKVLQRPSPLLVPHTQPGPHSALSAASLGPLPTSAHLFPTHLFAVRRHEVEAAGGNGERDWHSSKLQVTPPQNGAERAAAGLRKGPGVSGAGGSRHPEAPTLLPFGILLPGPTHASAPP